MNGTAAMFGFILLYDSWAMSRGHKTITAEYRHSFEKRPVQTALATSYVLAHLLGKPRQFKYVDIFERYALAFGYLGRKFIREVAHEIEGN